MYFQSNFVHVYSILIKNIIPTIDNWIKIKVNDIIKFLNLNTEYKINVGKENKNIRINYDIRLLLESWIISIQKSKRIGNCRYVLLHLPKQPKYRFIHTLNL